MTGQQASNKPGSQALAEQKPGGQKQPVGQELGTNRLALEVSPYLLQHQHNPVDWWPWGEAALAEARRQNKPILLSVGYAACHWCHVMAHESFEDPTIAGLMNELFINIKVDREERPDLDAIYQQALALLGQQGGWPLTMFLLPDGRPFWGGTYFPPASRWGRPGFTDILRFIAETYATERESVGKNVEALGEAMRKLSRPQTGDAVTPDILDRIAQRLVQEVDTIDGGIKGAPKFPQVPIFRGFWQAWQRNADPALKDAVIVTLDAMCQGGIYDHLGGGFARYSTDGKWLVPHFEKMLYDNAELIGLLTLVWQETRSPLYAARVAETVSWLEREMLAEADDTGDRAFAASLDADSEGVEGKFYVWQETEIDALLGHEASLFKRHYDVSGSGNWEETNVLNRRAARIDSSEADEQTLTLLRGKLLAARNQRVRPGWDDKVLADWNGLMIAALAGAATAFNRPPWLEYARGAFRFIERHMMKDGRLYHAWRNGKLGSVAMLDDHAHLARAALLLQEATGDKAYRDQAERLVALLDRHFWDDAEGGYFTTADDVADVIIRQKGAADQATPNGNGVMVEVLSRLYHLTGKADYARRAMQLITAFSGEINRNFFPLATYLNAIDYHLHCLQIVLVGARDNAGTDALLDVLRDYSLPTALLQRVSPDEALPPHHPAQGKEMIDGRPTIYLCRGQTCSLPISDPAALALALNERAI
ncbi:MAG: thioredoxin domain-containing protein [Rhodospirillaceae bacterium]|nr:MAG: thioredoxin domain-containing protein [Rhodospirillaceae bacterium]